MVKEIKPGIPPVDQPPAGDPYKGAGKPEDTSKQSVGNSIPSLYDPFKGVIDAATPRKASEAQGK